MEVGRFTRPLLQVMAVCVVLGSIGAAILATDIWRSDDPGEEVASQDGLVGERTETSAPFLAPTREPIPALGPAQALGEAQTIGLVRITLNRVRESELQFPRPRDGELRLAFDLTVENLNNAERLKIFGAEQTDVRDASGRTFKRGNVPNPSYSVDGGTVPPGGSLQGELAFDVAVDATGLEFGYIVPNAEGIATRAIWSFELP